MQCRACCFVPDTMKEMDHILRLQQRITLVLVSCCHLCQLSQSFRLRLWQKITGNICSVSITIQYASQAGMCLCRRAVEEVCAGKHLAMVVPSGRDLWLMSYPSLVASDRQEATHLCHSVLTSSPRPAASCSLRDFPDVPRFPYVEATVVKSPSWHCVCDTLVSGTTFLKFWVY